MRQLLPPGNATAPEDLLRQLSVDPPGGRLRVGDDRIRQYLHAVGRDLLAPARARQFPELGALGFFLRPGRLDTLLRNAVPPPGSVRLPRGMVFQITPANVDSLFLYSWALSALVGNRNVVRISSRLGEAAAEALAVLRKRLADAHPAVAHTQRVVSYHHGEAATDVFSAAADLRVIWGGDETIREVRRSPMPPDGRDLTFADRSSFAVIDARGWLAADDGTRELGITRFCNDAYWFDQAACASPRAVFWVGPANVANRARIDFYERLVRTVAATRPAPDAAMAIEKRAATYGLAAQGTVTAIRFGPADAVAFAEMPDPRHLPRRWLGAGTFVECIVRDVDELLPAITRQVQTITHFGLDEQRLVAFGRAAVDRGVDRVVPIGAALTFSSLWDGHDLVQEFTRLSTIQT